MAKFNPFLVDVLSDTLKIQHAVQFFRRKRLVVTSTILRKSKSVIKLISDLLKQEGGRNATHYLKRLHLSHGQSVNIVKHLKKILSPIKALKRHNIKQYRDHALKIPNDKDFIRLPDGFLSGTVELVAYYNDLFRAKEQKVKVEYQDPFTLVVKTSVELEDSEEIRPIIEFSKQTKLFNTLCSYIGELPVISDVSLAYTESNRNAMGALIGSSLFHRDMNESRQLHMVIPIWEVDIEAGPFTFLPSDKSDLVAKATRYNSGRLTDEAVFNVVDRDQLEYAIGKPGTVFLVNPFRCFHYGARTQSKKRLILIVNFTSVFEGAEGGCAVYRASNRHLLDDGDPKTRALLNL